MQSSPIVHLGTSCITPHDPATGALIKKNQGMAHNVCWDKQKACRHQTDGSGDLSVILRMANILLEKFERQGKDDGWVLLGWNGAQSLQVAELEGGGGFVHDICCALEGARGIVFALCRNHLRKDCEDVKTWKRFPYYWPCLRGIGRFHPQRVSNGELWYMLWRLAEKDVQHGLMI